jgi:hypothetical protein
VVVQDLVQPILDPQDLARVDVDVRGLSAESAHRLVEQHARVRQREALARRAGRQQDRRHGGGLPMQMVEMSGFTNCIVS